MSNTVSDRLARIYARATTATLCDALDQIAGEPAATHAQARTWLIDELLRRSPAADAASLALCDTTDPVSQHQLAAAVSRAARADTMPSNP